MTDDAALLRAILVNPADDTPRLVYADWLDENGQPERAAFVRVQCELGYANSFRGCGINCETGEYLVPMKRLAELTNRERELWVSYPHTGEVRRWVRETVPEDWTAFLATWAGPNHYVPDAAPLALFSRGFVSEIRLPLAAFMDHAKTIFERHPVERVVLTTVEPWHFGDGEHGWFSEGGPEVTNRATLPPELTRRMGIVFGRRYPSREAAMTALSTACVRYGRQLAGLPA